MLSYDRNEAKLYLQQEGCKIDIRGGRNPEAEVQVHDT